MVIFVMLMIRLGGLHGFGWLGGHSVIGMDLVGRVVTQWSERSMHGFHR